MPYDKCPGCNKVVDGATVYRCSKCAQLYHLKVPVLGSSDTCLPKCPMGGKHESNQLGYIKKK